MSLTGSKDQPIGSRAAGRRSGVLRPRPAPPHRGEWASADADAVGPAFGGPSRPALDPERVRTATRVSQVCALVGLAIGLLVLIGWALDVVALKSVTSGMVSTKPNAALAFALTGASLLLLETRAAAARLRTVLAMVLAGVVVVIGVLTLIEYAFGVDLGIDQLLFHESSRAVGTSAPARMAVASAVGVVFGGGALVLVA